MRVRILAALFLVSAIAGPASGQRADDNERGGIRTETMSRTADLQFGMDLIWNIVGLIGLVGLFGLRRDHPDDSYHPATLE